MGEKVAGLALLAAARFATTLAALLATALLVLVAALLAAALLATAALVVLTLLALLFIVPGLTLVLLIAILVHGKGLHLARRKTGLVRSKRLASPKVPGLRRMEVARQR